MSQATTRDSPSGVILTDYTKWSQWIRQLKTRATSLNVWEQIDPSKLRKTREEPTYPPPPAIDQYEGKQSLGVDEDGSRILPRMPSDLSSTGSKAWKEDLDYHKVQVESYKDDMRKYQEERQALDKIVVLIQQTVTPNLMRNCCIPGEPIRTWFRMLQQTVGINDDEERDRARDRYIAALKPMRQPSGWEAWLAEYDDAATTAESEGVSEVQRLPDVVRDFLRAIIKVAPTWEISFKDQGRREANMTRKEMMKRFRDHMSDHHPTKGKLRGGAFAAGDVSFLAGGESDHSTNDRDASHAAESAHHLTTNRSRRGRPRYQRPFGHQATSKQSSTEDTAAAEGVKCPACEQRHKLEDCYYAYPENAPQWFTPRSGIAAMVRYRLEHDTNVQGQIRGRKRSRTRTPTIKQQNTPEASSAD